MKKFIIYLMAITSPALLLQCNSLEMEPESSITDANYWKTEAHFSAFNTGLHSLLRKYSYHYFLLGESRANLYCDDNPFGGEATQGIERLPYNTLNKENPVVSNFGGLYVPIERLNMMIRRTSETDLLTDADKNYYLGEAYGMRAYLYFHLLRSWGDVVLSTDPTDGASLDVFNLAKAASPAADVMKQIKADIEASEKAFGDNHSFKYGRHYWSLPATWMLKGEVYLWSGRQMGGGNADYQVARMALEQVGKADVALSEKFESVFAFSNKKNKEIIFTIHNQKDEFSLWDDRYRMNMLPQDAYMTLYYDEEGKPYQKEPALEKLRGLIRLQINYDMYQKLFRDEDSRKRATLKAVYSKDKDDNLKYVAPYANKFKGTLVEGNSSCSMLDDYPIYRYADCLLMLAEVKVLLGEDPAEEINKVRERAYGANYFKENKDKIAYPNDTDPTVYTNNRYVGSDADALEAILKERLREFMFEGKRWYDLRLLGEPYLSKYSKANASRLLWPINEDALTNNPLLKQTPGYE
ncbi:SusD family outer membrane lipoprotein NanU [Tannerella forsythia]|uniref:SusD family outer membrane lipoprotein NanU n=1 Tax=Tannerella forsythia TaxID=28112 RepID=UPI0028F034D2|nr:SusD family outer membrane lipoprotein NanU [Tannerella forsythia]